MSLETEQLGHAIRGVLTIVAIYAAWRCLIRESIIEDFRQDLFGLRRELFLAMAQGRISRNNPEYVDMMKTLSVLIRHPEKFTFYRFILMAMVMQKSVKKQKPANPIVVDIRRRMSVRLVQFVGFTSLVGLGLVLVFWTIAVFFNGIKSVVLNCVTPIADSIREEDTAIQLAF